MYSTLSVKYHTRVKVYLVIVGGRNLHMRTTKLHFYQQPAASSQAVYRSYIDVGVVYVGVGVQDALYKYCHILYGQMYNSSALFSLSIHANSALPIIYSKKLY